MANVIIETSRNPPTIMMSRAAVARAIAFDNRVPGRRRRNQFYTASTYRPEASLATW